MANTMETYILKTPKTIDNVIRNRKSYTKKLVDLYLKKDYKRITLVGCGSSYNGCVMASPFLEKYLNADIEVIYSNEFMYSNFDLYKDNFVLFFSQSGCSTNTIAAIDAYKKKGNEIIALTGNLKGDLNNHVDYLIDWKCGEETVGFVTIGLTILVLFLDLFALETAYKKKIINSKTYETLNKDLLLLSKAYEEIKENTKKLIQNNIQEFTSISSIYSIGFTTGYAVSHEGALKLAETIRKPSILQEGEEFAHGPNNSLTPNSTCFFIDSQDLSSKRLITLYKATREITSRAYIVTNAKEVDNKHAVRLKTNVKEKLLSPIYLLAFFQTIAFVVANMTNSFEPHPLLKNFKKIANTKTDSISKVMPDYEVRKGA